MKKIEPTKKHNDISHYSYIAILEYTAINNIIKKIFNLSLLKI